LCQPIESGIEDLKLKGEGTVFEPAETTGASDPINLEMQEFEVIELEI
jgi:hypothetical protein